MNAKKEVTHLIRIIFCGLACATLFVLFGCANSGVKKGEIYTDKPSMKDNKSRLIIYRDTYARGYYQTVSFVDENIFSSRYEQLEFNLTHDTYKEMYVEPGDKTIAVEFCCDSPHPPIIESFTFESGKTYYLKILDQRLKKTKAQHIDDFKADLACEISTIPAHIIMGILTFGLTLDSSFCPGPKLLFSYDIEIVDKLEAKKELLNLREATNLI